MGLFNLFQPSQQKQEQQVTPKPKVLLAEDEVYLLDVYKELLIGAGYDVITAVNGQEAVQKATQMLPKVILLDIMMPVMDGMQALSELRKNDTTKNIPVIILTNAGSVDNMESAKFHKVFRFLIKSNIVPDEVVKTTNDALASVQISQS